MQSLSLSDALFMAFSLSFPKLHRTGLPKSRRYQRTVCAFFAIYWLMRPHLTDRVDHSSLSKKVITSLLPIRPGHRWPSGLLLRHRQRLECAEGAALSGL